MGYDCMADEARFSPVLPLHGVRALPPSDQIELSVVEDRQFVQLFAVRGRASKLCKRLEIGRRPGRATVHPEFVALPTAPGQWLLTAEACTHPEGLLAHVADRIGHRGYLSEQSDSRVCIRLGGSMARRVMAKGCRLDLHPRAAGRDFCAQTVIARVGVTIHQVDDTPTYDLLLYSGFARSFWDWIAEAAAEFAG